MSPLEVDPNIARPGWGALLLLVLLVVVVALLVRSMLGHVNRIRDNASLPYRDDLSADGPDGTDERSTTARSDAPAGADGTERGEGADRGRPGS